MTATTFLNLTTNTEASGSAVPFLDWRLSQNNTTDSNMTKIDTYAQNISASVVALQSGTLYLVDATESTTNNYVATVTGFGSLTDGKTIHLSVDVTTTGTATLNVNSLGVKTLCKVNSSGNAINLASGDLVKGRYHIFIYNVAGGVWLWSDTISADQINIAGNVNNIPVITGSGIGDSGISASSIGLVDQSTYVWQLGSNLTNERLLSTGSGVSLVYDSSASTTKITNNIVPGIGMSISGSEVVTINGPASASSIAPSTASYVVLSSDSVLTNEKVLTAGSNITIVQDTSSSTVLVHNTGPAANGWISAGQVWTYATASTIFVTDASSIFSIGDKLKYVVSGSTIYQYVINLSGSTVSVSGGLTYPVPSGTISNNYYSHEMNPVGFPQWFELTSPSWTTSGAAFTNSPAPDSPAKMCILGRKMTIKGRYLSNAISGGTGIFIATFQASEFPEIVDTYMGGYARNLTTQTMGLCFMQTSKNILYICHNGGATIATNSEYFDFHWEGQI